VPKHRDASAAPSQVPDVQRWDVERPFGGGRGEARVAACLDGQETIAPSSLLAGGSHRAQETLRAMNRDRDKKATGGRIVGVTGARTIERQQAAFSVRSGGHDEAVLGYSRRARPKHRFVTSSQSFTHFASMKASILLGGLALVGEVVGSGR
jgi:hypothetical protein